MNKRPLPLSTINVSDDFYEERRRYRNGFVMLYHYLVEDNWKDSKIESFLKVERIVRQNDTLAHSDWPNNTLGKDIEDMANFSIIDFPKSYKSLFERSSLYNLSNLNSVSSILKGKTHYSYADFSDRKNNMQTTLSKYLIQSECEKDNNI